jgi:hypothetical protein
MIVVHFEFKMISAAKVDKKPSIENKKTKSFSFSK